MEPLSIDDLATVHLQDMNLALAKKMKGSCIFISSPILPPLDDGLRIAIEGIIESNTTEAKNTETNHLIVLLETKGGVMETVERMVSVIRAHYEKVSFIIPNYAYSAGTVFALSGDNIYMDYYSVLGPIDPQYWEKGKFLPGQGYLSKFQELLKTINDTQDNNKVRAESLYLSQKFDPAQLFHIEQAVKHGRTLIREWLPKYKFKNWKKTDKKAQKVTDAMKKERAENIAETLGNAEKWHSHGRGISMKALTSEDIKLQIDDFGKEKELNRMIRNYYSVCIDYHKGWEGYIHTHLRSMRIM